MSALRKGRTEPTAKLVNDTEEPIEVLASEIKSISAAMTKMRNGALRAKTITLLISHASGVPQRDVERVLEAMSDLGRRYTK